MSASARHQLTVPLPCAESWDAMTPAQSGRHCAACQKIVIDFTQKTDAELLAYFRQARPGQTCGRFYADQLSRPLREAPPLPATSRWRATVALLLAAWGTTQAEAAPRPAPAATYHAPRRAARRPAHRAARFVQGTVRDAVSGQPLRGVAVFLRGENRRAATDRNGWFGLRLSPRRPRGGRALVLHYTGYVSSTVPLAAARPTTLRLALAAETGPLEVSVVGQLGNQREERHVSYGTSLFTQMGLGPRPDVAQPAAARPASRLRQLWLRLTRPFHRTSKTSNS